nr:phospholipase D-like domain-containing protein [Bradyrhizobium yuanmingense]
MIRNKSIVRIILSNSSADRETGEWDKRNAPARAILKANKVEVQNRLFNNRHIGHNKFAVYLDKHGDAKAVMTGSTNWTSLGLCGQTNNSIVIENEDIAEGYRAYWQRLHDDEIEIPTRSRLRAARTFKVTNCGRRIRRLSPRGWRRPRPGSGSRPTQRQQPAISRKRYPILPSSSS